MNGWEHYGDLPYLWSVLAKATALLVAGGLAAFLMRRSRPASVHLLWIAVFAGAVLIPMLSVVVQPQVTVQMPRIPTGLASTGLSDRATPVGSKTDTPAKSRTDGGKRGAIATLTGSTADVPANPFPWPQALGGGWFLGFSFVSARYFAGLARLSRWRRLGSRPVSRGELAVDPWDLSARIGLGRGWNLRMGDGAVPATAVTWGVMRPVVFLPAEADKWSPQRLEAVLVHELAHVRRRDFASQALAEVACALYWFNPIVWLGARAMRAAAERAADDAVLACGVRPSDYASDLLEIAKGLGGHRVLAGAGVFIMTNDRLEKRLRYVLSATARRKGVTMFHALVAAAACAMAATGLVSLRLAAHQAQRIPEPVPGPYAGRVLLPDGKPAAGVRVSLITYVGSTGRVFDEKITELSGEFSIGRAYKPTLGAMEPKLVFEKDGCGLTFLGLAGWENGGTVKLALASELHASFVLPTGQPAAGLTVSPYVLQQSGDRQPGLRRGFLVVPTAIAARHTSKTSKDGSVVLQGLPRGFQVRLTHDAPILAKLTFGDDIELADASKTLAKPIHLKTGGSVSGRVTFGDSGKPAGGVAIIAQEAFGEQGGGGHGNGNSVADQDGRFVVSQLSPGDYNLNVLLEGQMDRDWTSLAYDRTPLKAGERRTGLDIKLIKGGLIVGTVKYSDGKPVIGTHVGVYGPARPRSGAWVQNTLTDKDGKYALRVPAGANHVYLQGGPGLGDAPRDTKRDVTVEHEKEVRVDFAVPR